VRKLWEYDRWPESRDRSRVWRTVKFCLPSPCLPHVCGHLLLLYDYGKASCPSSNLSSHGALKILVPPQLFFQAMYVIVVVKTLSPQTQFKTFNVLPTSTQHMCRFNLSFSFHPHGLSTQPWAAFTFISLQYELLVLLPSIQHTFLDQCCVIPLSLMEK
jgi:hypothetical protein